MVADFSLFLQNVRLATASFQAASTLSGLQSLASVNGGLRLTVAAGISFFRESAPQFAREQVLKAQTLAELESTFEHLQTSGVYNLEHSTFNKISSSLLDSKGVFRVFLGLEPSLEISTREWKKSVGSSEFGANLIASSATISVHWSEISPEQYIQHVDALANFAHGVIDLTSEY